MKLRNNIVAILFVSSFLGLNAQSSPLDEVKKLGINDLDKIFRILNAKSTEPRQRLFIMENLNILLLENSGSEKINYEVMQKLAGVYENNPEEGSSYNSTIRKKACIMLSQFDRGPYPEDAIEKIGSFIKKEKNVNVSETCIAALGNFPQNADPANKILLELLNKYVKKKKPGEDDEQIMSSIITSLGRLKQKSAYIPLMKVLESKYSTEIKNSAKEVLESY